MTLSASADSRRGGGGGGGGMRGGDGAANRDVGTVITVITVITFYWKVAAELDNCSEK